MCTVSWLRRPAGYVLLCNRDERHTRQPAASPRVGERHGISFIAPADGDHGGTWIGVNQFGLTLCLLNRYGDAHSRTATTFTSRGLLLTELLDCEGGQQTYERVEASDLEQFQPFTMTILTANEAALVLDWTGRDCLVRQADESQTSLTSSSLQEPQIGERRREQFQKMLREAGNYDTVLDDTERLWQFHRSHLPERGPYSVCMHREDAATVSLSAVTVTREVIEFVYHPGSPCVTAAVERVSLERICQYRLR